MTSETPNFHVSKNLNISRTKQDIEKLKTSLRLVWKCCSVVFKIGSKIFSLQWHFQAWSHSVRYIALDEVYCDMKIINIEVRVISRAEGKDDNSYRDIDNFAYHKNRIQ